MHFLSYGHEWCFESSQNCTSLETSRVTINHEMYEQVHTIFYLLSYCQQNYSNALYYFVRVMYNIKRFSCFQNVRMFYMNQSKKNALTDKSSLKFLKVFETTQKISRKLNFKFFKSDKSPHSFFKCLNSITQSTHS